MLLAAVRDPDPVLFIEPVPLYRSLSGEVEDNGIAVEIGPAETVRKGNDITAVTYGPLRHELEKVADELSGTAAIETEVIDLKTLIPWDVERVTESVRRIYRIPIGWATSFINPEPSEFVQRWKKSWPLNSEVS